MAVFKKGHWVTEKTEFLFLACGMAAVLQAAAPLARPGRPVAEIVVAVDGRCLPPPKPGVSPTTCAALFNTARPNEDGVCDIVLDGMCGGIR